jgi:ZIP family zinc transporter
MTAILLSLATFFSTLAGGLLALRQQGRLHYVLSFTAGVLLGVVSFDILPEIFAIAHRLGTDATGAMLSLVIGFLIFHTIEKFILLHHGQEDAYAAHHHPKIGLTSALALIGHSFMDGIGIGLGFQASPSVGIAVAIAVISHDFCDGINTVSLMLVHRNSRRRSTLMLLLDAAAPVAGALSTLLITVPPAALMLYLGFFAGFLLYIAAADVLPEAHSRGGVSQATGLIALTCAGAALVFVVVQLSQ